MKELTQLQDISSKVNFKNVFSSTMQLLCNSFIFNKLKYCHLYSSSPQLKNIHVTDLKVRVTNTSPFLVPTTLLFDHQASHTQHHYTGNNINLSLTIPDSLDSSLHN